MRPMKTRNPYVLMFLAVSLVACGDDDSEPATPDPSQCSVKDQTGCEAGLACEEIQGGTLAAFAPWPLQGR